MGLVALPGEGVFLGVAQQVAAHPRGPGLGGSWPSLALEVGVELGTCPQALPRGCWLLASEAPYLAHFG